VTILPGAISASVNEPVSRSAGEQPMSSASWLSWTLAALMIGVALYHVARIVAWPHLGRCRELDVDVTHAVMGLTMAGMLVGSVTGQLGRSCIIGFGLATAWFGWRAADTCIAVGIRAVGHPLRQMLGCGAMLYMFAASANAFAIGNYRPEIQLPDGKVLLGSGFPLLTGLLAATGVVTARTIITALGAAQDHRHHSPDGGFTNSALAPALAAGCQAAMSATTVYMLAMMI
jgi:TRAP-type C4-dicarboxylate transport system permease small subunit